MFSERERKILEILGRKRMTITEISEQLFQYGHGPLDEQIASGNSIRRIIMKCEHHKLDWTLVKTRENGKMTIKKEKI